MAGAVYQYVNTTPFLNDGVDQALQVFVRLVTAGYPNTAQFLRQRFPLPEDDRIPTLKPSAASRRAAAAPMPLPPAVTIATFLLTYILLSEAWMGCW